MFSNSFNIVIHVVYSMNVKCYKEIASFISCIIIIIKDQGMSPVIIGQLLDY